MRITYADWAVRVHGFVKPPSVRPLREQQRRRPWTKAERHRLQELWHAEGNSGSVAVILKRDRDDVRCAIHLTGLRDFSSAAREEQRHAPAGYYAVFSSAPSGWPSGWQTA